METKKIIFLDIDGTLIQEDQKPNTPELPQIISQMSAEGFLFGLNSNRALEDITQIYLQFGLNGPIILENGIYFKTDLNDTGTFLVSPKPDIHPLLVDACREFFNKKGTSAHIMSADTVSEITRGITDNNDISIMINKYRKYTGSIHVYKNGARDGVLALEIANYLRDTFKREGLEYMVEVPPAFMNIVIYPTDSSKRNALQKLKNYYVDYDFVMIGDDIADAESVRDTNNFYAVGNATPDAKAMARYVANATHTKGVIEILEELIT